jgi:hypothetical protein
VSGRPPGRPFAFGGARDHHPAYVTRPSDRRRDRTVAAIGDGYAAGCIGTATLELRVAAAQQARTFGELRRLTADLPVHGWLHRLRDALASLGERDAPVSVTIAPPPDGPGPWIVGRGAGSRLVLDHETVSRRHAQVRRTEDGWEILDLDSTNGTWVNGWRVERATLRPGDVVHLGDVRVHLVV